MLQARRGWSECRKPGFSSLSFSSFSNDSRLSWRHVPWAHWPRNERSRRDRDPEAQTWNGSRLCPVASESAGGCFLTNPARRPAPGPEPPLGCLPGQVCPPWGCSHPSTSRSQALRQALQVEVAGWRGDPRRHLGGGLRLTTSLFEKAVSAAAQGSEGSPSPSRAAVAGAWGSPAHWQSALLGTAKARVH